MLIYNLQNELSLIVAHISPCIVYTVLQIFKPLSDRFVDTFYAMSRTETTLRCPLQPGALVGYYYGSWERDGETVIEIPAPNNGIPQDIVQLDPRYDLDRVTFSLIINSVEATDANSRYECILSVFNPAAPLQQLVSLQTDAIQLSLMVNGKSEHITNLQLYSMSRLVVVVSSAWADSGDRGSTLMTPAPLDELA